MKIIFMLTKPKPGIVRHFHLQRRPILFPQQLLAENPELQKCPCKDWLSNVILDLALTGYRHLHTVSQIRAAMKTYTFCCKFTKLYLGPISSWPGSGSTLVRDVTPSGDWGSIALKIKMVNLTDWKVRNYKNLKPVGDMWSTYLWKLDFGLE